MLRSYLSHYSDAYVVVKKTIDILSAAGNGNHQAEKDIGF